MITPIAKTNFRGQDRTFGIKRDDRSRHIYIIGKTGMGKTGLLKNMTIADIEAGHGVAVIDPHGEYAEELLEHIPSNRVNDVIYFNPADLDYPIAFNAIEQVAPENRHLVASGLMGVFKKIWPDVWSARMEYILNNTILALLEYPNSTLLGIMRMLSNKEYRAKVLDKVTDPVIRSFWLEEYAQYNERFEKEAIAPIQNKVGQFISASVIRNIIGQTKSSIDMREVMDNQKILIMDLSKGRIGEDNSKLLGGMLVTKLQIAAMSRVDIPEAERKDFYLYVDEFQNFATDSFADILSEARKYKLNLTLGHQYIAQIPETVRDAVFGNVGTLISFRVGAEDAEFLEKEFLPDFAATDLVNLAKYNIYLKLMIDGVASRPFSAITLAPKPVLVKSNKDKIIRISRERYAQKRKDVEEKITRWTGLSDPKKNLGQKNNPQAGFSRQENKPRAFENTRQQPRSQQPQLQPRPPQQRSQQQPPRSQPQPQPKRDYRDEPQTSFKGLEGPMRSEKTEVAPKVFGDRKKEETVKTTKEKPKPAVKPIMKQEQQPPQVKREVTTPNIFVPKKQEVQERPEKIAEKKVDEKLPKTNKEAVDFRKKTVKQAEVPQKTMSLRDAFSKDALSFTGRSIKKDVNRDVLKKLIEESLNNLEKEKSLLKEGKQADKNVSDFLNKTIKQTTIKPGEKIYFGKNSKN